MVGVEPTRRAYEAGLSPGLTASIIKLLTRGLWRHRRFTLR